MKENHLAGASFWKLGYEKNTIWDTIAEAMQRVRILVVYLTGSQLSCDRCVQMRKIPLNTL
ncbi:MAG: hypothetical protein ACLUD0_01420 [Eubacterium ramulus]